LMPSVMAALPNIGGMLCESSVISFLVPRCKLWLAPLLECRAVTLPIFVSDIAIFVLKRDVKLQLTN